MRIILQPFFFLGAFSIALAINSLVYADIRPPKNYVEQCTLGNHKNSNKACVECEVPYTMPNRCVPIASHGLEKVCRTRGGSFWKEIWCGPKTVESTLTSEFLDVIGKHSEIVPSATVTPSIVPSVVPSASLTQVKSPEPASSSQPKKGCAGCVITSEPKSTFPYSTVFGIFAVISLRLFQRHKQKTLCS